MTATIRRGAAPRRPVARRKPPRASTLDRLLARLPVGQETLRRAATLAILAAGGTVAVAVASWAGVFTLVGHGLADAAGRAGLRVEQIEITGLKRMDRMTVYAVALDQRSRAMPAVDLEQVRQNLLRYGWVADAHVSRRLPDTLLIDIEERVPAAVWQDQGQLTLIDAGGTLLEPVDPAHMPDLPLVIGPGADRQEPRYQALMAAAPQLRSKVRGATWVGNRRWDLTFATGETLALPEGEREAAIALARFAHMDAGPAPLLGRGWMRFDMRDPTRLVARKPGRAREALAEPAAATRHDTHDGAAAGAADTDEA
jgi:cell division protein FtsQ